MRLLSLFSGIGAFEKALTNLKYDFTLVGYSEIDRYASKSYSIIHGVSESLNLGDVTQIESVPDFDLMTWGFPCQDISVAGKQKGLQVGTRSSLYTEGLRILAMKRPKYSIFENVKNLVGKNFKVEFDNILKDLEALGYTNYWKVLNAKDYGIPQNRERVFCISILGEHNPVIWPTPFENGVRLVDMLEDEVDEKYYIGGEKVDKLLGQLDMAKYEVGVCKTTQNPKSIDIANCLETKDRGIHNHRRSMGTAVAVLTPDRAEKRQNGRRFKTDGEPMFILTGQDRNGILWLNKGMRQDKRVYSSGGISPTLMGNSHGEGTGGYLPPVVTDGRVLTKVGQLGNDSQGNRVYDVDGIASTQCGLAGGLGGKTGLYLDKLRIRRLTPLECLRLMGFDDNDYWKAKLITGISDTQLYKQAGNSIVVNVLEEIFKEVFV